MRHNQVSSFARTPTDTCFVASKIKQSHFVGQFEPSVDAPATRLHCESSDYVICLLARLPATQMDYLRLRVRSHRLCVCACVCSLCLLVLASVYLLRAASHAFARATMDDTSCASVARSLARSPNEIPPPPPPPTLWARLGPHRRPAEEPMRALRVMQLLSAATFSGRRRRRRRAATHAPSAKRCDPLAQVCVSA